MTNLPLHNLTPRQSLRSTNIPTSMNSSSTSYGCCSGFNYFTYFHGCRIIFFEISSSTDSAGIPGGCLTQLVLGIAMGSEMKGDTEGLLAGTGSDKTSR